MYCGGADGVGSAGHFEDVALGVAKLLPEGVELCLLVLGENSLVKAKVDGDVGHGLVAVQTLDHAVEGVGAVDGIVRRGFCVAGGLGGVLCILGSAVGGSLRLLDAGLGAVVYVVEVAIVGGRFFIELIGMVDQGSGLRAHVILGRAAGNSRQSKRRHTQPKSSFHHLFESSRRLFLGQGMAMATSLPLSKMHPEGQT